MIYSVLHTKISYSKCFALLLFVGIALGTQQVSAQRNIEPWEAEFDYSYALTKIFPFNYKESSISAAYPQHLHYNQFFSNEMKGRNISVYEIKKIWLTYDSSFDSSLERREYKDGYLTRLLNKNLCNTDSAEYLYKYELKKKKLKVYCSYKSFKENELFQHIEYEANFNKKKQLTSTSHAYMPSKANVPTKNVAVDPLHLVSYNYQKSGRLSKIIYSSSNLVYPPEVIDFSYTIKRKPSVPIDLYTFTAGIDSMLAFCIDTSTNSYVFDSVVTIKYNNFNLLRNYNDTLILREVYYVKSIIIFVEDNKKEQEKRDEDQFNNGSNIRSKTNFSKSFIAFEHQKSHINKFIRSREISHYLMDVNGRESALLIDVNPTCYEEVTLKSESSSKILRVFSCEMPKDNIKIKTDNNAEVQISLPIHNGQIVRFNNNYTAKFYLK